ncbi:PEP-CTERM sorting domain-containing protein [Microcystis aeruginosa CS-564/01]|uniref:choice-of-anchor R domain-containing protein n=1 Tax=Microcystis aeruginosa TaxID=1126 RepID=UPI00232C4191|nr:choice-of-anchor R domain-containing protein [Microcystis aeruginosa]MDB9425671.1 PEP-CTERM sorting domain-containing protein [Microcystis aeruginosa CS-564/01]
MTKNQQILAKMGGGSLALLLSLSLGQQASATTLVDNLPPTTPSPTEGRDVNNNQWLGSSFTTGSVSYGYTLKSATLFFALEPGTPLDPGTLLLRLYSNASGVPGSAISGGNFNVPTISSVGQYNFTLTNPQQLVANTTYWLVAGASNTNPGTYRWGHTSSPAETGLAGWSIGNTAVYSVSQGIGVNPWTFLTGGGTLQFSVNGTENPPPTNIPEPGSVVALLGLGGLGLASRLKKLSTRA